MEGSVLAHLDVLFAASAVGVGRGTPRTVVSPELRRSCGRKEGEGNPGRRDGRRCNTRTGTDRGSGGVDPGWSLGNVVHRGLSLSSGGCFGVYLESGSFVERSRSEVE